MASMSQARSGFGPKLRSRKDGAAIPLDELDKRLLNLMQGSFPIAPRPYQHVANEAGITETGRDGTRQAPARRAHHPPGHADLRHARARLLVDAGRGQGRPREPVARRQRHQRASRRLPQLPAQPRVQHLVHDRDRARLAARTRRNARGARPGSRRRVDPPAADAEAVQDPHGSRDGGRDRRARQGGRGGAAGRDRAPALRRVRHRGDPGYAGRHAGDPRAVRARCRPARDLAGAAARPPHRNAGAPAASPRRGDPVPPSRGLQRKRDGRVEGARRADHGARSADGRIPGDLSLLPAPHLPDWPYSIFTMAHGRSKEECDAILDSIAAETGIDERATLYSSTEFKKIRLLYFTDEYRAWEREHAGV